MNDPKVPIPTFGTLILAGGQSRRMGADKASLPYRGQTLLRHMCALARCAGSHPVLVGGGPLADLEDPIPHAGPVSGICALARALAVPPDRWVIVPVDMPLLSTGMLHQLAAARGTAHFEGSPLPFAFTLDSAARAVFDGALRRLAGGESLAVRHVLDLLAAVALQPAPWEVDLLSNANTPEEWDQITAREEE